MYVIKCRPNGETASAVVTGWIGDEEVDIEIIAEAGEWRYNGVSQPKVSGCVDIDINFSPVTNLLAIRRLEPQVGQKVDTLAAWLKFPGLTLEPLPQSYHRISESKYRYESANGAFKSYLEVNNVGFVTHYPELWHAVL